MKLQASATLATPWYSCQLHTMGALLAVQRMQSSHNTSIHVLAHVHSNFSWQGTPTEWCSCLPTVPVTGIH